MLLELDFGRGLVRHVELENITDEEYAEIVNFFAPMVNDAAIKSRVAIANAFEFATQLCPDANPSDLWHHVIYRTYCREKLGTNPEQSWVRTSGEAFELAVIERYNPYLEDINVRLRSLISREAKHAALRRLNMEGRIGSSKIDVLIEKLGSGMAPDMEGWGVIGGLHAKASLAERISDDIPASRIMMGEGLLSVLVTLDVKSFPPPHGDLVNRGEFGTPQNPSDKRNYIELHGDFSAAFSYNLRTRPSLANTPSGRSIFVLPFAGGADAFVHFVEQNAP